MHALHEREARETLSPLAGMRPAAFGRQERETRARAPSVDFAAAVVQQAQGVTVGARYGKGRIVGVGNGIFENGDVKWVHRPQCKSSECATPNAHHLMRQRGAMKGYCINCISSIMEAETRRQHYSFATRSRTQLAGTTYGKGMVISTGVDDGPWVVVLRCAAPHCTTAHAKPYLVKKSGKWEGHCIPCIAALVAEGKPPYPLPPPTHEEWRTRSIPGFSNTSVQAHIAMRVDIILPQLEATPSFRVPPDPRGAARRGEAGGEQPQEMLRVSPPPPIDAVDDAAPAAALDALSVDSVAFETSSGDESTSDVDSDLMMHL